MTIPRTRGTDARGFTLIEMAIVLVVVAILAGMVMPIATRVIDQQRFERTQDAFDRSQAALAAYGADHQGCLPFADTDSDGQADTGQHAGTVPWETLGLSQQPRDGRGPPLRYAVTSPYADAGIDCAARGTRQGTFDPTRSYSRDVIVAYFGGGSATFYRCEAAAGDVCTCPVSGAGNGNGNGTGRGGDGDHPSGGNPPSWTPPGSEDDDDDDDDDDSDDSENGGGSASQTCPTPADMTAMAQLTAIRAATASLLAVRDGPPGGSSSGDEASHNAYALIAPGNDSALDAAQQASGDPDTWQLYRQTGADASNARDRLRAPSLREFAEAVQARGTTTVPYAKPADL